jgi:hypothetical protein
MSTRKIVGAVGSPSPLSINEVRFHGGAATSSFEGRLPETSRRRERANLLHATRFADQIEEMFDATGSRGGFMLSLSQGGPNAVIQNIVNLLVPKLQRRSRCRTAYEGQTLRENLLA